MDTLAYDVKPKEEFAGRMGFRYASLEELLSQSDIITLHVPVTKATHHLNSDKQVSDDEKRCCIN